MVERVLWGGWVLEDILKVSIVYTNKKFGYITLDEIPDMEKWYGRTNPNTNSNKNIFFLIIDTIRKFLPSLKPMNPKILQEKYYEKHREKIAGLEKKLQERENEDTSERHFILSRINPKLRAIADRYAFRSDLAWGGNIEQRYKSAWFNVLSGEAYELAGALQDAGAQFHYAAHSFRELGVYRQAARYYHKSTLCFKESGGGCFGYQSV